MSFFFFLEKSFCSFIKTHIYKHFSNLQHGGELCDLRLHQMTLSVHTVCIYNVTKEMWVWMKGTDSNKEE